MYLYPFAVGVFGILLMVRCDVASYLMANIALERGFEGTIHFSPSELTSLCFGLLEGIYVTLTGVKIFFILGAHESPSNVLCASRFYQLFTELLTPRSFLYGL